MSGYLFPFVIISMHLLVVLIGAGYMARTKRLGSRMAVAETIVPAVPIMRRRSFAIFRALGARPAQVGASVGGRPRSAGPAGRGQADTRGRGRRDEGQQRRG